MNNPLEHSFKGILTSGITQIIGLCKNPISIFGIICFIFGLGLVVAFGLWKIVGFETNNYLEATATLIFPGLFFAGLFFIPLGIFRKHRRQLRFGILPKDLEIRVGDRRFIGSVLVFIALTIVIVVPVISVSAYSIYHYTESTRFCGEICHTVMEPQATAHAHSPHARVRCAECHIGSGAGFFVKSKLSGLRQVYAVAFNTYPTPIPPAITELRPARDTCEECHWPSKFFGTQYRKITHFTSDENNTQRDVEILIKTGGTHERSNKNEGIHMHMLAAGTIEYVAVDDGLQDIPWVQFSDNNGTVKTFKKGDFAQDALPKGSIKRTIDCMDCHNRGAHHFLTPQEAMNYELESKRIDSNLPYIMRQALDALTKPYPDEKTALASIEEALLSFYQKSYPLVWANQQEAIKTAVKRIKTIYQEQFFPHMKENWSTYPENIGHRFFKGCFRCHDGLHLDDKGKAISSNCKNCHLFVNRTNDGLKTFRFGKFEHPKSLSIHQDVQCSNCHGTGKLPTCKDCHKGEDWSKLHGTGNFRLPESDRIKQFTNIHNEQAAKDLIFQLDKPKNEWDLLEQKSKLRNMNTNPNTQARPEVSPTQTLSGKDIEKGGKQK